MNGRRWYGGTSSTVPSHLASKAFSTFPHRSQLDPGGLLQFRKLEDKAKSSDFFRRGMAHLNALVALSALRSRGSEVV